MQIDFISDTICPWCFIGKRRLGRAMAMRPDIIFNVRHRPYRLDPAVPPEGVDRAQYLAAKFGGEARLAEAHKLLTIEGEKEGIAFAWDTILRTPNTLNSHRLIRWAETRGVQDEVVERLFVAYFENGEDIGDTRVLSDIADLFGMDGGEIADLLESDTDVALVEREDQLAHEMGITGVPAMIFANRIAVSGAREAELLAMAIDKATEAADNIAEEDD